MVVVLRKVFVWVSWSVPIERSEAISSSRSTAGRGVRAEEMRSLPCEDGFARQRGLQSLVERVCVLLLTSVGKGCNFISAGGAEAREAGGVRGTREEQALDGTETGSERGGRLQDEGTA